MGVADEIRIEQDHVDRAFARLEELRAQAQRRQANQELDRSGSTFQSVYERDVFVHYQASLRSSLGAAYEGLIFGRLDMTDGEVYRIGRLGLRSEDFEPLVIDWRAPAAGPFYRATPADPLGVVRRRTIRLRGQKVIDIEDDLLDASAGGDLALIGDGALLSAVTRAKGEHMRDIVQTIQREQDEIIRAADKGVLLVTGGPGTGKTAVALHRVAYLLYESREHYRRGGVLVVGPTPRFMDYVSKVLPSLGEDSTVLRSLSGFVTDVEARGVDMGPAARAKGSLRAIEFLARLIEASVAASDEGISLRFEGRYLTVAGDQLATIRKRLLRRAKPFNELVGQAHVALAQELAASDPQLDEDAAARLVGDAAFREIAAAWWPALDPVDLFRKLQTMESEEIVPLLNGIFDDNESAALIESWTRGDISQLDIPLIDELRVMVGQVPEEEDEEPPGDFDDLYPEVTTFADRHARERRSIAESEPDSFAHVVVDEAQDLTPMQWRMVWRRGEAATWTIVGDWAQSANSDPGGSRHTLERLVGRRQLAEAHLETNYRGASEIAALAEMLLRKIDPTARSPRAVRESGHQPVLVTGSRDIWSDVRIELDKLAAELEGTLAVIVPVGRIEEAEAALGRLDQRVTLVSSIESKGLEFDGAVVVDPEGMVAEHDAGLRLLYVAMTRPAHLLTIVSTCEAEGLIPRDLVHVR